MNKCHHTDAYTLNKSFIIIVLILIMTRIVVVELILSVTNAEDTLTNQITGNQKWRQRALEKFRTGNTA